MEKLLEQRYNENQQEFLKSVNDLLKSQEKGLLKSSSQK